MELFIRLYKNGTYRAYYWSNGQHVYKDGQFETYNQCWDHFTALGFKIII